MPGSTGPRRRLGPLVGTLLVLLLLSALPGAVACRPRPNSPLTIAAARGDIATIDRLAAAGADIDAGAGRTFTPLIWAARAGQTATVRRLVSLGANINQRAGVNAWTPLRHALHTQQTATVVALLELGAAVADDEGRDALMMAAGYGNERAVQQLIDRGVDPHRADGDGPTLLALAAAGAYDIDYRWKGCAPHTATVKALLARAPDLRLSDGWWDQYARRYVERKNCQEMLALLDAPATQAGALPQSPVKAPAAEARPQATPQAQVKP